MKKIIWRSIFHSELSLSLKEGNKDQVIVIINSHYEKQTQCRNTGLAVAAIAAAKLPVWMQMHRWR